MVPLDNRKVSSITEKLLERDNHVRESWVKVMELHIFHEELGKCQKREGVNHYENCKWLAEKYMDLLRKNRVVGFRKIDV